MSRSLIYFVSKSSKVKNLTLELCAGSVGRLCLSPRLDLASAQDFAKSVGRRQYANGYWWCWSDFCFGFILGLGNLMIQQHKPEKQVGVSYRYNLHSASILVCLLLTPRSSISSAYVDAVPCRASTSPLFFSQMFQFKAPRPDTLPLPLPSDRTWLLSLSLFFYLYSLITISFKEYLKLSSG